MLKGYFLCCTFILFSFCFSCKQVGINGKGKSVTETRNIPQFTSIEIDAPVDATIDLKPGLPALQLTGYRNLLQYINTEVKDSVLHIYITDDVSLHTDKDIQANISAPALYSLAITGTSDVTISGLLLCPEFDIDIAGAGKVVIDRMQVDKFQSDVSGVAKIQVNNGTATNATYNLSGDGIIKAFGLQSKKVEADVAGAGSLEVSASDNISGQISGAAHVRYKGHPTISAETSGTSNIVATD